MVEDWFLVLNRRLLMTAGRKTQNGKRHPDFMLFRADLRNVFYVKRMSCQPMDQGVMVYGRASEIPLLQRGTRASQKSGRWSRHPL
jgi:hypothetical protein